MLRTRSSVTHWNTWITVLSVLVVALVLVDIALVQSNRRLQAEVSARGQFIQQSIQLEGLSREIVTAIASLSVQNNDDALKALLTQHGITFSTAAPQASRQLGGAGATGPGSGRR